MTGLYSGEIVPFSKLYKHLKDKNADYVQTNLSWEQCGPISNLISAKQNPNCKVWKMEIKALENWMRITADCSRRMVLKGVTLTLTLTLKSWGPLCLPLRKMRYWDAQSSLQLQCPLKVVIPGSRPGKKKFKMVGQSGAEPITEPQAFFFSLYSFIHIIHF